MSDRELRAVERELATTPASLELRRQYARLLLRAGPSDAAVDALDLAWRLGAAELWGDLQRALAERRLEVRGATLCYVPGGPFVMGRAGFSSDAAPPHLVTLAPFYIAARPLSWIELEEWAETPRWYTGLDPEQRERFRGYPAPFHCAKAKEALAYLTGGGAPDAAPSGWQRGAYALPTEAQWERAHRAKLLTSDGSNPYGLQPPSAPEWTADRYDATTYDRGAAQDPTGPTQGKLHVVRGVPNLPEWARYIYREAADDSGEFPFPGRLFTKWVPHTQGIATRFVYRREAG